MRLDRSAYLARDPRGWQRVTMDTVTDLETAVHFLTEHHYALHEVSCPCEICEFVNRVTVSDDKAPTE